MIHLVSVLYWVIVTVFISRTKRQCRKRHIFSHIQFLDVLSIHSSEITKQYVNKYVPKQILINIHWHTSAIWNPKPPNSKRKHYCQTKVLFFSIHVFIIWLSGLNLILDLNWSAWMAPIEVQGTNAVQLKNIQIPGYEKHVFIETSNCLCIT